MAMSAFLLIALLLYRPAMLIGNYGNATSLFPRWELALLAGALILFQWKRLVPMLKSVSKWTLLALAALLLSALAHFFVNGYRTLESLGLNLAFLTIPLFAALNRKEMREKLPVFFALLWTLDILLTLGQHLAGKPLGGIPGNWNWNAALILVTTPFALLFPARKFKGNRKLLIPLLGLPVLLSAALFCACGSRAAALGLLGAGYAALLMHWTGTKRKILLYLPLALLLAEAVHLSTAGSAFPETFLRNEIRPSIWESTLALIADHPLGVGAESFELRFAPYRTAEYFLHRHMAWRTIHPHNELLNIAACLGIPALLAWIFLTVKGAALFLRRWKFERTEEKLFFLAFLALLIHGMLDLTFFAWPLDVFALLLTGYFWAPVMRCAEPNRKFERIPQAIGALALCGIVLSAWINFRATADYHSARTANPGLAARRENRAAQLTTAFPEQLYQAIESALMRRSDPKHALVLAKHFENTPYRNISRIHGLKALALAMSGRDEEALKEYRLDSANFPYLTLPYIGQITCLGRLGRTTEIPAVEQKLYEIMKIRGLSRSDLMAIMKNPELDRPR